MASHELIVPENLRSWISNMYAVVDSKAPDSGEQLAKLYTADASVYGLHGVAKGTEAIIASRKTAWDVVVSRAHTFDHVYTRTQDFSDVLVLGKVKMGFKNGKEAESEFVAQVSFESDAAGELKGSLYKVYADSAPFVKAMTA